MSSSTWRVLSGYATYQRIPIRMTSGGKCAPLKLIAMSRSLMLYRWSWSEIIPQKASKKNLRQNLGAVQHLSDHHVPPSCGMSSPDRESSRSTDLKHLPRG